MNKVKAGAAWAILLGSLPRGIGAFVTAVAGISLGVPLSVFFVGLPVLAATLIGCRELLAGERRLVSAWENGRSLPDSGHAYAEAAASAASTGAGQPGGWRGWVRTLMTGNNYRGLVYGLLQLPIAIAAFTLAVVIPVMAASLTLAPLADIISSEIFSFDLYAGDWIMNHSFLSEWSSFQRSWVVAGIGAVLLLLTPPILRKLGRYYAGWINWISGPTVQTKEMVQKLH